MEAGRTTVPTALGPVLNGRPLAAEGSLPVAELGVANSVASRSGRASGSAAPWGSSAESSREPAEREDAVT
jgi:hypothetical protein